MAYRICPDLAIQPLPDGEAVVARPDGSEAVIVNASAHAILGLFTEAQTEEQIASVFSDSFPEQDITAIRRDVAQLFAHLVRAKILEPCGTAPSTP